MFLYRVNESHLQTELAGTIVCFSWPVFVKILGSNKGQIRNKGQIS